MEGTTFLIILAVVTLLSFFVGGTLERRRVRAAWKRGDRSYLGMREERRREDEQNDTSFELRR